MATLDPRLRLIIDELADRPGMEFAAAADAPLGQRVGWNDRADGATIEVLVEATAEGDLDAVAASVPGAPLSAAGSVRPLRLPVTALPALAGNEAVARVEAARPLFPELNWSRRECRAQVLHEGSPPITGTGVVVAVIDSGIDYTHPCFRRGDGGTRIIALWDQAADAEAGGGVPFGREYRRADIERALQAPDPHTVVPHRDRDANGHGTHVAGIVCGDERGSGLFTGIAPDAELIVVALDTDGVSLGSSPRVVAALDYVRQRAGGRPVVVNLSQGSNSGGHCGDSLLERRIDELSRQPGFVVVKSAGNEQQWGIHAGGMLSPGEDHFLPFDVVGGNHLDDVVEVWFGGGDDVEVGIATPSGASTALVRPGASDTFETGAGNRVRIDVDDDADGTGDRRASLILRRGTADQIQPGRWSIVLRSAVITDGRYDAWIDRTVRRGPGAPEQSRFAPGARDATRTITIPGTARHVITVGSYVTKSQFPDTVGKLSGFSSLGPTRDGRAKPDLAAPGEFVASARAGWSDGEGVHATLAGTSMAAPHVAGVAALVLQAAPLLTADQVAQVLRRAARADGPVEAGPDGGWGSGKIDAAAAVSLSRAAAFPTVVAVQEDGSRVSVKTDVATTARLTVTGADPIGSPEAATVHTFELAGLPSARNRYRVEVTADGWTTVDDNGGRGYAAPTETLPRRNGAGHEFTVVAVAHPGGEPSIEYDVTDLRSGDRAAKLDGQAMLSFLEEKTEGRSASVSGLDR
ncbi:hypothetical protein Ade02nite_69930 [Paractinoplanes deccanensis]|uniref:Peptidase S8/S53 domain-containing protein n=1 Tax=Paractinoplanes deccanensis TaxID=113561 RepID=A0ABQ3YED3_9ACTN|nr:S8 family peptidase [Actinoplanes deccanensis]GID78352.1 hypothetical protein Ade02nite_69930 [Actinoplanes deccanensis]